MHQPTLPGTVPNHVYVRCPAAAAELEAWLLICRNQPAMTTLSSRSSSSSGSSSDTASSLPSDLSSLQPWHVEGLRQLVVLSECEQLAGLTAGLTGAAGDSLMARLRRGAAATDAWLQDYTHMPQV
jgi:hypothetical protein